MSSSRRSLAYSRPRRRRTLTLFGRSVLLLGAEVAANVVCWVVTAVLFARTRDTQPILALALLAWTLGLRHALDADHISAIDNATRGLLSAGQLPVTCGLFFSLGHSTIVVVVNVAIAISSDVYARLDRVGSVGGIVGAAVSGAFLFVVGLANAIILWRIVRQRRQTRRRRAAGEDVNTAEDPRHNHMFMMRLLGPVITFVDRPWKMYPVGVLFGFGFDTASSIALLAVSALAKKGADGRAIPPGDIVVLPLLFTAGMTLIDSCDSVLMLYSYAGFPERSWALLEDAVPEGGAAETQGGAGAKAEALGEKDALGEKAPPDVQVRSAQADVEIAKSGEAPAYPPAPALSAAKDRRVARDRAVKMNAMSGLSIVLTLMSILVAFSISIITILGLIGEQCARCRAAADDPAGGGLAGRWWRGWAKANDNSGYIGAAIVGSFVAVVSSWYGSRWAVRRWTGRRGVE